MHQHGYFGSVAAYLIRATLPNYPCQCILIDYFNNSNFSKIEQCAPWWWWLHRNVLELF